MLRIIDYVAVMLIAYAVGAVYELDRDGKAAYRKACGK